MKGCSDAGSSSGSSGSDNSVSVLMVGPDDSRDDASNDGCKPM